MQKEQNAIYLVSKQSFTYNDEGYVANEEGTTPLKAFMTEASAKAFGTTVLITAFENELDTCIEPLIYEGLHEKRYEKLVNVAGVEIYRFFEVKNQRTCNYYSVIHDYKVWDELKSYLQNLSKTLDFDKNQTLYHAIVGSPLVHIEKIQLEL